MSVKKGLSIDGVRLIRNMISLPCCNIVRVKDRVLKPLKYVTLTPMLHALCIPTYVNAYVFMRVSFSPRKRSVQRGLRLVMEKLLLLRYCHRSNLSNRPYSAPWNTLSCALFFFLIFHYICHTFRAVFMQGFLILFTQLL